MSKDIILEARSISKAFTEAKSAVHVFSDLDLTIEAGERVAIVGRSGSGKSTLLQLLGGLDKPSKGQVYLTGASYQDLSEKALCELRNKTLGFVYQFHHLLPEFTALENVAMPLLIRKFELKAAFEAAAQLLERIGLKDRLQHKVAELSGGERQRVAIARALVPQPRCILADEPTGNLDGQTAAAVFAEMLDLNKELNTSLVIVTHDPSLAAKMDRVLTLSEGRLNC